jgi:ubiquinone/menaquinone biosynthesis C-methylase UbiE
MSTPRGTYYSLGHSDAELRRLMWQAEVLRPHTERLLRMAKIRPGMRVLDVGCGTGDVAMLAARLVGRSGSVTGIDRSQRPLATAARRCESARLPWVQFHHAALEKFSGHAPFDAVIGRYVVIHQTDPASFLPRAARTPPIIRPTAPSWFLQLCGFPDPSV